MERHSEVLIEPMMAMRKETSMEIPMGISMRAAMLAAGPLSKSDKMALTALRME
jgi:hypothetical protein